MQTGIIFNGFICLLVAGVSFWVSKFIWKEERKSFNEYILFGFWFSGGLLWLLVAVGLFLYENGHLIYDFHLNRFGVQGFIFLQVAFGATYGLYRIYQKKTVAAVSLVGSFILAGIGYYFLLLPGGFRFSGDSYFSVEYHINPVTWKMFQIVFAVGVIFVFYDILKYLIKRLRGSKYRTRYFLTSSSVLVYSIIGYFDNQGISETWVMVLLRSIIILGLLATYLAYAPENLSEEE